MNNINNTTITHPSYAMASFTRVHCGGANKFFASDVDCQSYIELRIKKACEHYRDGKKYPSSVFDGGGEYIRVAFTPSQFAELLTSLNLGDGAPCTLKRLEGKPIEGIPDNYSPNSLDFQKEHFKKSIKEFNEQVNTSVIEVGNLLKKKNLSKADKEKIMGIFGLISRNLNSNIPFALDVFKETTDQIVNQAKSEIDSTIQHSVMNAGIKAMGITFENHKNRIGNKETENI